MALDNRGGTTSSTLIYLLVATAIIYLFIKIVPPYMDYYSMEDEIRQQVSLAQLNSQEVIYNDIKLKMNELELPVYDDSITMSKDNSGNLSVVVYWTTTVDFGYGVKRDFPFDISVNSGDLKK